MWVPVCLYAFACVSLSFTIWMENFMKPKVKYITHVPISESMINYIKSNKIHCRLSVIIIRQNRRWRHRIFHRARKLHKFIFSEKFWWVFVWYSSVLSELGYIWNAYMIWSLKFEVFIQNSGNSWYRCCRRRRWRRKQRWNLNFTDAFGLDGNLVECDAVKDCARIAEVIPFLEKVPFKQISSVVGLLSLNRV